MSERVVLGQFPTVSGERKEGRMSFKFLIFYIKSLKHNPSRQATKMDLSLSSRNEQFMVNLIPSIPGVYKLESTECFCVVHELKQFSCF